MIPPNTITIKSDGNKLSYHSTLTKGKEVLYVYIYVLSPTKLGQLLPLTENDLTKLIKVNT